ncbi:hypothetical protein [Clostridium tetani]|uniref:Uncharacterized protein n=1 Tax=Clostridium tetani TaxID=1513 RepID=A0ABC8EDT1_CLOTA|nr:hypothetical protein [Clostridium tetani]BDR81005.1 hypothetical protein K234311028_12510 [Clostridium tetani]
MKKRKILSVYIEDKIGEEANLNIDIELSLNGLISESDIQKALTNEETHQINEIVFNIIKRVNKINNRDEISKF